MTTATCQGTGSVSRLVDQERSASSVRCIDLPAFFCPIAPVMHPEVKAVESRSIDWAGEMGLCPDDRRRNLLVGTRSAEFYAGMTLEGIEERLDIAAQWVYWGFSFDDACCDEGSAATSPARFVPLAGRILRILASLDIRLCSRDPHLLALHNLALRYQQQASPVQLQRWVEAHRLWLLGVVQQNTHRAQKTPLSVDDYLAVRLHDCGGPPTQSMYEFVNGLEVPGEEMDSPQVRAITEAFWMIAALDNDRVSRHKELLGQNDDYNIVDVVRRHLGCSSDDAMREAIKIRDRVMNLFLALSERLMRKASPPLRAYLTTLGHGIRSNIDWSLSVPRYGTVHGDRYGSATTYIEFSGRCMDEPSDASLRPLPFPSIAWWWEQLAVSRLHAGGRLNADRHAPLER